MWIYLNNAALSIVKHDDFDDVMIVRSRTDGDIEAAFGDDVEVVHTPDADYHYRTFLPRGTVARALAGMVDGIDYGNFKKSVPDHARHDHYLEVWSAGWRRSHRPRRWELDPDFDDSRWGQRNMFGPGIDEPELDDFDPDFRDGYPF